MKILRPGPSRPETPGLIRSTPAMLRDFFSRRYPQWPTGTFLGACLGLLYILNPLDFIPDAIPGVGLVDDSLMVGVFLALLSRDVKKYQRWKQSLEEKKEP